ncbi:MAG: hypothetical protein HC799_05055 [Limnothrix sp. RL_2_0]|nr:hypothetical protein [Limnothrix sp. RL_2_0]
MVYFNKLERRGLDQGVRRGILNQIRHGLDIKFPQEASSLFMDIQRLTSLHTLKIVENRIYHVKTTDELRSIYRNLL